jgi:acyl carrier protein
VATREDAPGTPLEQAISEILKGILGLDHVGIHENFFALGGHSLMGAQVIARLRDTFGVQLTLRDLFLSPTISKLANRVEELLVDRLESMSDEEVSKALAAPNQAACGGAHAA